MGIKPLPEALWLARESDMDLVEVAPGRDDRSPPVCKVMDYGRWRFEEDQRAKESRRKASNVTLKELRYRPKIAPADFDTKTRKVADFLSQGHKVKITITFRWRETSHPEFGRKILDRIAEETADIAKVEAMPKLDGRNMTMVLAPEKKAAPKKPKPDEVPAATNGAQTAPTSEEATVADPQTESTPPSEPEPQPETQPETETPPAMEVVSESAPAADGDEDQTETDSSPPDKQNS